VPINRKAYPDTQSRPLELRDGKSSPEYLLFLYAFTFILLRFRGLQWADHEVAVVN
jgi:hypothetical protein